MHRKEDLFSVAPEAILWLVNDEVPGVFPLASLHVLRREGHEAVGEDAEAAEDEGGRDQPDQGHDKQHAAKSRAATGAFESTPYVRTRRTHLAIE